MASGISPTSGAHAAVQAGFQQLKLQQARRSAEQAEQVARSLRATANEAQQSAERANENARSLGVQADQAQTSAGHARQGLNAIKSLKSTESALLKAYDTAIQTQIRLNTQTPQKPAEAVVNTQGQTTGTLVNTTA